MDHENVEPKEALIGIIEDLVAAEGRMGAARDKMSPSFLADNPGYQSIAAHMDGALASAGAALAETHDELHQAKRRKPRREPFWPELRACAR